MIAGAQALLFMVWHTFKRQLLTKKMVVAVGLLVALAGLVYIFTLRRTISAEWFGRVVTLGLFSLFFFPMLMLCFGTAAIGDDRDDKTLVYLLTRPLPRWGIYVGKLLSVMPLALGFGIGGFWLFCRLAARGGGPGMQDVFGTLAPAFVWGSLAYLAFFHFLSAVFRHSTLIAVVYVLFVEAFIGSVPGILKRVSIRFYTSSLVYDRGAPLGIEPPERFVFLPMDGEPAQLVLIGMAIGFTALGALYFSRREYHDTV